MVQQEGPPGVSERSQKQVTQVTGPTTGDVYNTNIMDGPAVGKPRDGEGGGKWGGTGIHSVGLGRHFRLPGKCGPTLRGL